MEVQEEGHLQAQVEVEEPSIGAKSNETRNNKANRNEVKKTIKKPMHEIRKQRGYKY